MAGLPGARHYTPEMDERIKLLWGAESLKSLANKLGKSKRSVTIRAAYLGLRRRAPEGFEAISSAAVRTGFHLSTLRRILKWAEENGVLDKRQPCERLAFSVSTGTKYRQHVVDTWEVDEAVSAWMDSETLAEAGAARGVEARLIKRALVRFGEGLPVRTNRRWRVRTAAIDAALAKREAFRRAQS